MDKFEQLEIYESKQKLTGRVFDFSASKNEILITKYYDVPHRKIVFIPDFVDGFNMELDRLAFSECKYIEKVVANSNIHGSIYRLFKGFEGKYLDLTEFDTSNIENIFEIFFNCDMDKLIIGGKFKIKIASSLFSNCDITEIDFETLDLSDVSSTCGMFDRCKTDYIIFKNCQYTKNLVDTSYMFCNCDTKEIILNGFDTSNVLNMGGMFEKCKANKIDFGNSFNTSKVVDMSYMFCGIGIKDFRLPENFNTKNVENMDCMFSCSVFDSLTLDSKFDTYNVKDVACLFSECFIDKIYIGANINTHNITNISYMFYEANIIELHIKNEIDIEHIKNMEKVFYKCKIHKITIDRTLHIKDLEKLHDLFNFGDIKIIDLEKHTKKDIAEEIYELTRAKIISH